MPSNKKRQRQVFLITRSLIQNGKRPGKSQSEVMKFLSANLSEFKDVITNVSDHSPIVDVIISLSKEDVFESELKAKLKFPELFQPSPERSLQHEVSERNALRSEAEALRERIGIAEYENPPATALPERVDSQGVSTVERVNLFPIYLSYISQHEVLQFIQASLEECCFSFATKQIPKVLESKGWACPEAVELTRWVQVLPKGISDRPEDSSNPLSEVRLRCALVDVANIRHAAVHRLPTNAKEIEKMLQNGLHLARILQDRACVLCLETLTQHLSSSIQNIELYKNSIEAHLDAELELLNDQRNQLGQRERDLIQAAYLQDEEDTERICAAFSGSIAALKERRMEALSRDFEKGGLEEEKQRETDPEGLEIVEADIP